MYNKKIHIHFIGIGGIGMSGIATILRYQGYEISGCDIDLDQQSIKNLQKIGCAIYQGNNSFACQNAPIDIVVYSSAINSNNPEITTAQVRGIPTISRALMLAELMRTKFSIAIAGSHGKTTTTSLISHILIEANVDPTIIIGGHLKSISSNARIGKGDFLVAEADESDRSFLYLHTTLAIITNIDLEHLETYQNLTDIKQTFSQFLHNLPFYGKAIVYIDDPNIQSILPIPHIKTITYGFSETADFRAIDCQLHPDHSLFTVIHKTQGLLGQIHLNMPGIHNIQNALASIALAVDLSIPFTIISQSLKIFKGVDRRFTFRGTFNSTEIFDDYGHHPQEILHTLTVARNRTKNKLTVVFQPHRYTRTEKLWDSFISTFLQSSLDTLIITDIYPASELPIPEITSKRLVTEIQKRKPNFTILYVPLDDNFDILKKAVLTTILPHDLLLLLGAGKVNKLVEKFVFEE